jgi:hypothetical protein
MLAAAVLSLGAQRQPKDVMLFALDLGGNDPNLNQLFTQIQSAIPHHLEIVNSRSDAYVLLKRLATVVEKRSTQTGNPGIPQIFFFLVGAHRYRELRSADPYMQSEQAKTLIKICQDGPEFGVHTLLWCDNMSNVGKILQRSGLEFFDARAATLIAANESNELFDGPQASRLGSNRAYFRHQEWEAGRLEKFKPYALPEPQVIAEIGKRLRRKV